MKIINKIIIFIIGGLFIFSGLVKIDDPVGTAIKLEEYFGVFATDIAPFFEVFIPYALPIAVFVVVLEVVLGVALLANYRRKTTLFSLLGLIIFFTFLTFYSAYFNKVTDCGCFGDFIPLEPWESFTKDVILLVLILILFFQLGKFKNTSTVLSLGAVIASALIGLILSVTAIRHLPFIDFRAYKIGANIPTLMQPAVPCEIVYIMEKDGQEYEFKEYPTDKSYTYKDFKTINADECEPKITDYNLSDAEGNDATQKSLTGKKLLIIVQSVAKTDKNSYENLNYLLADLETKVEPMILSSDAQIDDLRHDAQLAVPYYFADATVLKTMVRSNPGLILIEDGTVKGKWHYNDIPTKAEDITALLDK